jgi:hypothetical protein
MIDRFLVGIGFTVLTLAVGHWFPWPSRLTRMAAYAFGVAMILAGQVIWLAPNWPLLLGLAAFCVAAGITTGACKLIDWVLNLHVQVQTVGSEHERSDD